MSHSIGAGASTTPVGVRGPAAINRVKPGPWAAEEARGQTRSSHSGLNHRRTVMQMTPLEISNNSKLTQHVSTILPTYQTNQLVIDTMQKLAGRITKDTIKAALVWGQGPTVRVVVLPDGTDGLFNKGMKSNIIFISKKVVEEFVKGKGLRTTPKGSWSTRSRSPCSTR